MKFISQKPLEVSALTLLSAAVFAGFSQVNEFLFADLVYREGVSWIFLPAGFRVILVIILGLPGALGIMLGTWYLDRDALIISHTWLIMLNGMVSGLMPLGVLKVLSKGRPTEHLLKTMTTQNLLNFTLIFAAASSVGHQLVWSLLQKPDLIIWVDIWPMFIGDTLGTLLTLLGFKWVVSLLPIKSP